MRIVKYISTAIFVFLPIIAMSEDIAVPSDVGTEVLMETIYQTGKDITTKGKMILMKQGNRVRIEKLVEIEGKERLTGVSIYDGQTTWEISPMGKEKRDGFGCYPWTYSTDEGTDLKDGRLEGRDVKIVDVGEVRLYLDPEKDVILLEEGRKYKTYYKDYTLVPGMGYVPKVIEDLDGQGNLIMKTELKRVEQFKTFSDDTFNPDKVELDVTEVKDVIH